MSDVNGALLAAVEGVIADGLANPHVTDIIADPGGPVFFDYLDGKREKSGEVSERRLRAIIDRIAGMLGKTQDDPQWAGGLLEGEVPLDGSRIQAWVPPLVHAPSLVIRIHRRQGENRPSIDAFGLCPSYRDVIEHIVRERLNALIVGSTGSGKTTFLGATLDLVAKIHPDDRVVTIEDRYEIYCRSESWLALHSTHLITQRMLLKSTLSALPTWIIPGEVRDEVAIDLVESLTTGHAGLSTTHAGSCELGLSRILQLCRGAKTPEMVADAFQYVVEMRRKPPPDGRRYVHAFKEVRGYSDGRFILTPVASLEKVA
jgi:Flp pilus assembly CpaF family ATPase